jgi:Flp pilus assembly protein TadD
LLARDLTLVNPRPLINLGGLYILRENFERAIEILRAATAMTPESAEAYYNLGIALFRSRRLRAAEVPLLRAVELHPELPGLRLTLAEVYLRMRSGARAVEQLEAYLNENSEGKWRAVAQRMLAAARAIRDSSPPNPE